MPSVAFISGDYNTQVNPPAPNGCAYYRQIIPARLLSERGWDVSAGLPATHPEQGIGLRHEDGGIFGFDISCFKLFMHASVPHLIQVMQARREQIVIDVDDFHFAMHEENVAYRATDPRSNPENNRAFYEQSMRYADIVTVSTGFLADFYDRRCRDVRLVRNAVEVDRFTPVSQPELPTIGWLGGTLWRSRDIEMLRDWLPDFVREHGLSVHHAGHIPSDPDHFGARAGLKSVRTSPMSLIYDVPKALHNFHIGLVPLTLNPFNESKSYLKGLEYAASGIPFIASPTEEYRLLARDGVGRIAETADEWRDHATELLDPHVRQAEAKRNRAIVKKRYDVSVRGLEWDTALRS